MDYESLFSAVKTENVKNSMRAHEGKGGVYINNQGRLFGVTEKFDYFMRIEYGTLEDGRNFLKISNGDQCDRMSIKSSTRTTGRAFFNIQRICRLWYGEKNDNWAHTLEKVYEKDGASFFIVEENNI